MRSGGDDARAVGGVGAAGGLLPGRITERGDDDFGVLLRRCSRTIAVGDEAADDGGATVASTNGASTGLPGSMRSHSRSGTSGAFFSATCRCRSDSVRSSSGCWRAQQAIACSIAANGLGVAFGFQRLATTLRVETKVSKPAAPTLRSPRRCSAGEGGTPATAKLCIGARGGAFVAWTR